LGVTGTLRRASREGTGSGVRLKSTWEGVSGTVSVSPRAALMAERRVRKVCWDAGAVVGIAGSAIGADADADATEDWGVGTGIDVERAASWAGFATRRREERPRML